MSKAKQVRIDGGYANAFTSGGVGPRTNMMSGYQMMPFQNLLAAYIHNGFARLICDKPAEEMTRSGFEIEGLENEDLEQKIQSRLEELKINKRLGDAIKWQRAFGGSLIVVGIADGGYLQNPVNEESISEIEFLRVYDKDECQPKTWYEDANDPKFGQIKTWQISPKGNRIAAMSYEVHETRTLIFDGESVPNDVRVGNQGWGGSIIQKAFVQLTRVDTAYKYANLILERSQQAVHGIPRLADQLEEENGESNVTKRVGIVDRVRGVMNTVIIDAEETYEIKNSTATGVPDILDRQAEALSAVTEIPTYILLGRSVSGLGANGAANEQGWTAKVGAMWKDTVHGPLDRLVSLLILAYSEGKTDGGDYTLKMCPLYAQSDAEIAETELKREQTKKYTADTLAVYLNSGVMDQDEVREFIREDYELQGDAPIEEIPEQDPMVLNPGQKVVKGIPGDSNSISSK